MGRSKSGPKMTVFHLKDCQEIEVKKVTNIIYFGVLITEVSSNNKEIGARLGGRSFSSYKR